MGISFFGSSSVHDKCCPMYSSQQKVDSNPNPDPYNFVIKRTECYPDWTVVEVCYPDCRNYEGNKILVYNLNADKVWSLAALDPHFSEKKPQISPIARFVPTQEGWEMAKSFVEKVLT